MIAQIRTSFALLGNQTLVEAQPRKRREPPGLVTFKESSMPDTAVTNNNLTSVESTCDASENLESLSLGVPSVTQETIAEFIALHGERIWAVAASGHGSSYTFGPEVLIPDTSSLKTLDEARDDADRWNKTADTIGGDALVVHMPTYLQRIIDVPGEHPLHGPHRSYTEGILRTFERRYNQG